MVSVCLPPDALWQHLPYYLGFSYPGPGIYLHGGSSKAQLLCLTLDEGYLLNAAPPDLERGIAPLGTPAPMQPLLLGRGVAPPGHHPGLRRGVAPPGCCSSSNNIRNSSTHGHHQIVITEIRLIIFFAAKDEEALYSQQKQDKELTVAQIRNSLLPNSGSN